MGKLRKAVRKVLKRHKGPDAPGHYHTVRGIWDADGRECKRCRDWARLRELS